MMCWYMFSFFPDASIFHILHSYHIYLSHNVGSVVDDSNTQAVNLYKSEGYDIESIGNPTTAMPKYGQWTSGRSIMSKKLEK